MSASTAASIDASFSQETPSADRPEDTERNSNRWDNTQERLDNKLTVANKKPENVFTVDEAVNKMGFGPFQVLITVFCGLLWLADAMELMIIAILSPILKCQWDLTSTEEVAVTSMAFLGVMMGAVFWGFMSDLIGRKKSLLVVDILFLVFRVLSALQISAHDSRIPGYPWLLIFRFGVGFASAGTSQTVTYYAEFLPQKGRGFWMVAIAMWWTMGILFCATLAIVVLGIWHLSWHWFVGLAATPLAVVLVFFPFVPESARFYLVKGKEEKAKKVIEQIAKMNCKRPPSGRLVIQEDKEKEIDMKEVVYKNGEVVLPDVTFTGFTSIPDGREGTVEEDIVEEDIVKEEISGQNNNEEDEVHSNTEELQLLQGDQEEEPQVKVKMKSKWCVFVKQLSPLFVKGMWKTTILLYFIWFGGAWSYYGAVILTTSLLRSDPHCGTSVNVSNSIECEELGTGDYVKILWAAAAELPGLVFTFVIVDIIGRKKSMAIEFVLAAGGFLLLFICASKVVLTVFLFIIRAFVSGVFELVYVYTPEVYPTKSRALGLGLCSMAGHVGGIVTPIVAQAVFDANDYVTISLYAGSCLLFAVLSMLLPIETKGRVLHDKVG